jgi:hypothetical protein
VLSHEECKSLLALGGLGRVAVSSGALPAIYSLFFCLVGDHIVVRLSPTWALFREIDQAVVAFNVDHLADGGRSGWSILVQGRGEEVTDTDLAASLRLLPLRPWGSPADGDVFVRIALAKVSGTRFSSIV